MNVKVSLLNSYLHESTSFSKRNIDFLDEISKSLNSKIEITTTDDYNCDIKLIFIASGGSEGLFLENFSKLKAPYILLTTGENNSLAASLEILTYLNNNNLDGEILHGNIDYIASRIKNIYNNGINKKIHNNKANELKYKFSNTIKLGVLGKPSDWLISSIPSYDKIKENFNIELIDLSLDSIIEKYNKERKNNDLLENANLLYRIIKNVVIENNLEGITIRCFNLLKPIKMTACLALAKLNEEKIIGCCEGDIMAMISMLLVKKITNQSSFQANPSLIDINNNKIVLAHCTCPFDMLNNFKYMSHFESGIGVAIKGYFKKENITILRLSSDLKNYYVGEGKIIRNLEEENLCRSQIEVKMNDSLESLLINPCGNHHIVFYGNYKDKLNELLGG